MNDFLSYVPVYIYKFWQENRQIYVVFYQDKRNDAQSCRTLNKLSQN